ncbi:uncharacterized protein LOC123668638 [Melitaea cinxia]|uniref:uncharacterized protein LOC123668638 n=1 Tax=Melitaea cinxia TaxID=113334 RepID=UPI001E2718ED|nr:uncharacterized protein LOC123668638 [Melitaea cinxia]
MFSQKVLVFAVLIVLVSMVAANPLQRDWANIMVLQEFCVLQGGVCLPVDDCEPQNLVRTQLRGLLCSKQSGLECCYQS